MAWLKLAASSDDDVANDYYAVHVIREERILYVTMDSEGTVTITLDTGEEVEGYGPLERDEDPFKLQPVGSSSSSASS